MARPILQISSSHDYHYEVVEGLIHEYRTIIGQDVECDLYLSLPSSPMPGFRPYIFGKYPNLKLGKAPQYQFYIGVTIYPSDYDQVSKLDPTRHFFISHAYDPARQPRNVFYLAGMASKNVLKTAVLPFSDRPKPTGGSPIFLVQGDFRKRDAAALLALLLSRQSKPYRLSIIGNHIDVPWLQGWSHVTVKNNLGFIDYHTECARASAILTLVSPELQPDYYTSKLTSSITYARAYNLHAIIDSKLQAVYELENAHVYAPGDTKAFINAFVRALDHLHQPCRKEARDQPVESLGS